MKELKEAVVYLEDYDIEVKKFLTYAQIQKIIETTIEKKTWAERQLNIDTMILCYATNIGIEKVMNTDMDDFIKSGLITKVLNLIENYNDIHKGIEYHESIGRALLQLSENLPQIKETFDKEVMKNAV